MMTSATRMRTGATLLAIIVLALLPARSGSASMLQIIAPTPTLLPGQSEQISVMFTSTEVFNLTAADIEIAFDTSRFTITNVALGSLDSGSGFLLDDNGNNGSLSPLQSSISTSSPTGTAISIGTSGTLETFTLTALNYAGGDVGDLNLLGNAGRTNTAVYGDGAQGTTAIVLTPPPTNGYDPTIDATVTVGAAAPEPSSLLMMGLGGSLITLTTVLRKKARRAVA